MADYDPPVDNPSEVYEFGGLVFKGQEEQGYRAFWVFKDETPIGFFSIDEPGYPRENALIVHSELYPEWQRKGYGTIIYDFAETLAAERGKVLTPAYAQSPAAKAFWAKRLSR